MDAQQEKDEKKIIKISVRNLVEFILREGDIDNRHGRTANITSVMIPRSVIFIPRFLLCSFLPQVYTICRQRATACRTFFVQGAAGAAARR